MGRTQRKTLVLTVMEQSGVPLKSVDVARACKLRAATFEHRTVKNYLSELVDSGKVLKVDSEALDRGAVMEIDTQERGHFIAATAADHYRGSASASTLSGGR